MAFQKIVTFTLIYLAVVYQESHGSGVLTLRLLHYSNPTHKLGNGDCCEYPQSKQQYRVPPGQCVINCSNSFFICVTPIESNMSCSLGRKGLGWRRTVGDEYKFPPGDDYGNSDPLQFPFSTWNGAVVVNITIEQDFGELQRFVAHYSYKYARPTWNTPINLRGNHTSLGIMLNVYCDQHYLGPNCSKFCTDRDDDRGHYQCDYCRGEKKCLAGWYDPDTSCTRKKDICLARNDPRGHYQCDPVSGKKICVLGWEGENCNSFGNLPWILRNSCTT